MMDVYAEWLEGPEPEPVSAPIASPMAILLPSMVTLDPFGPEEEAFIQNMQRMERS